MTTCAHIARNGTSNRSRRPRLLRAVHRGNERRATSSTLYCGECEDRLVAKGLVDPERAPALAPPRVSARGPARAARTETAPSSEEGFSEETERMLKARRRSRLALLEAQLALVKRMEGRRTAGGAECDAASDEPAREQPGEVPEAKDSERAEPASPGVDVMHDALVAGSISDTSLLADIERLMRMSSADAAPATPGEVYELSPSPSR